MSKASVLSMAIAIFGISGCIASRTYDGGKLFVTQKTPMDGFFLMGNLAYVKNNLKVSTYADNGTTGTSNLAVEYANIGEDGIRLKVTCCWADIMGKCFCDEGATWKYDVYLFPYSKYMIQKRASKPAQSGTSLVCDHRETFADLWNSPSNLRK